MSELYQGEYPKNHEEPIVEERKVQSKTVQLNLELDANVNSTNKWQWAIDAAKAFDAWRPFPRAFIAMYIYLLYSVVNWFMSLDEPNMQQAGLVSVVVGAGAAWFGLYVNSKKDE
jgi:hypothetical protein